MTRDGQKQFITNVTKDLKTTLLHIADRLPENWDGHELRQWIADYYTANWVGSGMLTGKRKREYKNDLIVKNLI